MNADERGWECFFERKNVESNHQAGADDGCASPIHMEKRQAAYGKGQICSEENQKRCNHCFRGDCVPAALRLSVPTNWDGASPRDDSDLNPIELGE